MSADAKVRERSCPSCGNELPATAVLCLDCGYDTRTGTHLQRATGVASEITAPSDNPYQSPTETDDVSPARRSAFGAVIELISLRGRVSRRYWWFVHLAFALMECFFAALELTETSLGAWESVLVAPVLLFLWVIFATNVKRWHDIDKSGWWCLVNCVPFLGWLYSLVELGFESGTEGPNDYGEDPRRLRLAKNK